MSSTVADSPPPRTATAADTRALATMRPHPGRARPGPAAAAGRPGPARTQSPGIPERGRPGAPATDVPAAGTAPGCSRPSRPRPGTPDRAAARTRRRLHPGFHRPSTRRARPRIPPARPVRWRSPVLPGELARGSDLPHCQPPRTNRIPSAGARSTRTAADAGRRSGNAGSPIQACRPPPECLPDRHVPWPARLAAPSEGKVNAHSPDVTVPRIESARVADRCGDWADATVAAVDAELSDLRAGALLRAFAHACYACGRMNRGASAQRS
jgi:hypothetical protein